MTKYIRSFLGLGLNDVGLVGGKTASLGELYSALASEGVAVPNGFAITADAYRDALSQPGVADELHRLLDGLDESKIKQLAATAAKARAVDYKAMDTAPIREQIVEAYRQLEREAGKGVAVAVRSSATAEDLPTASFAGQHESFLNVRGPKDLFEENGLEIYVMCEIPNNVIQIDAFSQLFDGFSIGSNDLTQLTLGVDRDSDIVAFDFDERDPGMLEMFRLAVTGARRNGRHVGICGEAPANYPEIARYLTKLGIDSISVNPSSVFRTMAAVLEAEAEPAKV